MAGLVAMRDLIRNTLELEARHEPVEKKRGVVSPDRGLNALFFHSTMGSLMISSVVVVFISAVTAYETQMIKSMYREGSAMNDRAAIFGAFALYGSFVTLFIHILNILGIMRD